MTMCDKELLVGYLYDEADATERRTVETHLLACGECRAELKGLRTTRTRLASWAPPAPDLDFHVVRGAELPAPRARYWSVSPAWGLAAAAVLVLSVATAIANVEVKYGPDGLTVRTGASRALSASNAAPAAVQTVAAAAAPGEEVRRELQAISRRIGELEAASRTQPTLASVHATTQPLPPDVLRTTRQLISDSESRQQRELALRISQVLRDVEGARRVDYDRTQRALQEVQGVADTTILRQNEMANHFLRVVQTPR
jgi:Putative zinc-finger